MSFTVHVMLETQMTVFSYSYDDKESIRVFE